MTEPWDSPSVAELRERYNTYPERVIELAMRLVNESRLIQSSVSGFHHMSVSRVLQQVLDVQETLETITIELEKLPNE